MGGYFKTSWTVCTHVPQATRRSCTTTEMGKPESCRTVNGSLVRDIAGEAMHAAKRPGWARVVVGHQNDHQPHSTLPKKNAICYRP